MEKHLIITMTFRDKKILKFFKEHCSNTKFDRSWAIRNIFEEYFKKIKSSPNILMPFDIAGTNNFTDYGMGKDKIVVKVNILNPASIEFLKSIKRKNGRAFFIKNVILLYLYNRKAYNNPEIATYKDNNQELKNEIKANDLSKALDNF